MSSVDVSRPNIDVVNLEISQEGSAETNCYFRLPFLLSDKKYTVGVTSLTVPLMNTRMLQNPLPPLMFLRRRNVDQLITDDTQTYLDGLGTVAGGLIQLDAATLSIMARNADPTLDPAQFSTNSIPTVSYTHLTLPTNREV